MSRVSSGEQEEDREEGSLKLVGHIVSTHGQSLLVSIVRQHRL